MAKLPDFWCKKGIWKQKKVMIPLGMILSIVQIFGSILKQDLLNDRKINKTLHLFFFIFQSVDQNRPTLAPHPEMATYTKQFVPSSSKANDF